MIPDSLAFEIRRSVRDDYLMMIPFRSLQRRERARARRRRLGVETLEHRRVLATFLVTSASDVLDANDGAMTLREAVHLANESAGSDSILFDVGLFNRATQVSLDLGPIEISDSLRMTGPGQHLLTIDGMHQSQLFFVDTTSAVDLTIQGLTLAGGKTSEPNAAGAAVHFSSVGTLTVHLATVRDNETTGLDSHGGALYVGGGNLIVSESMFVGNRTHGEDSAGGAVFVDSGALLIDHSQFTGNQTWGDGSLGGAIFSSGATVSVERSLFENNATFGDSADGGAIYASGGATLHSSRLTGNATMGDESDGGALFASTYLSLHQSDFSFNETQGDNAAGGAIVTDGATVEINNSSVTANQTTGLGGHGAGLFSARSKVTINNTTISGNSAFGGLSDGGAVNALLSELAITGSTITQNNSSRRGGGVAFLENDQSVLTIGNSILAENVDGGDAPDLFSGNRSEFVSVKASLIGDNRGTFLAESQIPDAMGNLVGDALGQGLLSPQLQPLFYTGRTYVHPLDAASPAVDAGSNGLIGVAPNDQRGAPFFRIAGPRVDMGAFENQVLTNANLIVNTDQDEVDFGNTRVSLREAIMRANGTPGAQSITFDQSVMESLTIELSHGELVVAGDTTIASVSGLQVTIDGSGLTRLIRVTEGDASLTLREFVLRDGRLSTMDTGGGAIQFLSSGQLTIEASTISDNHTLGARSSGGAIFAPVGDVVIVDSTLERNTTSGSDSPGGALFVDGAVTITGSTLSSNRSSGQRSAGGAIATQSGIIQVRNSTLSGNQAEGEGGGVAMLGGTGTLQLEFATVAFNESMTRGGGLFLGAHEASGHAIQSSIIAQNSAGLTGPDLATESESTLLSIESSLLGDNVGSGLVEAQTRNADFNLVGSSEGAGVIDPQIAPLARRGGQTETHALLVGSPAIDAVMDDAGTVAGTDQRGTPFDRDVGDAPDMGAFELQTLQDDAFFTVTTLDDELDFSNVELSLREAIAFAAGSAGVETIRFDAALFSEPRVVALRLGQLQIDDSIVIEGPGKDLLSLDAGGDSRVVNVAGEQIDLRITGLTITGGDTSGASGTTPVSSAGAGGGIWFVGSGKLELKDVSLHSNRTSDSGAHGGALFTSGVDVEIISSQFSNNSTSGSDAGGGAIFVDAGSLLLAGSQLTGNGTTGARGFGGTLASTGSIVTISDTVIESSSTTGQGAAGGAIASVDSELQLNDSIIASSHTQGDAATGGAIHAVSSVMVVRRSSLFDNGTFGVQAHGGAASLDSTDATFINATISENSVVGAGSTGGGVRLLDGSSLLANQTTIAQNNSSGGGGGIHGGTNRFVVATISNSIVADNAGATTAPDIELPIGATSFVLLHSLVGDNRGTGLSEAQTPSVDGNLVGSSRGAGVIDPKLGVLQVNGGHVPTHKPDVDSPVVDAGDNSLAVDEFGNTLESDQRGLPFDRVFSVVDMGAFEVQPAREAVIRWPSPTNLFVGTPLSDVQLNAATTTAGVFEYEPAVGSVLPLGDSQELSVVFTPDDQIHYVATTAITTISIVDRVDRGDAPDSYSTLHASDGPRHIVGELRLGTAVDAEPDAAASDDASGDGQDDDGIVWTTSAFASTTETIASVRVIASARSMLDAWIDFNGDGVFDPVTEQIGDGGSINLLRGSNDVEFTIPAGSVPGTTFARFRISTSGGLLPTGPAADGEVEDVVVELLEGSSVPSAFVSLPRGPVTVVADGGNLVVRSRSDVIFAAPTDEVGQLHVIGDDTSNVVTIDSTFANAIPNGGLRFDGEGPVNTLRVLGESEPIDLSSNGTVRLFDIDVVDLSDGSPQVLVVDAAAVRAMDPSGGGVIIVGRDSDELRFTDGPVWRMAAPVSVAGLSFSKVRLADTFLQLDFGSPWKNLAQSADVNNDGIVSAGDALRIINELGRRQFSAAETGRLVDPDTINVWPDLYYDENGDGAVTALDALRVINLIGRLPGAISGVNAAPEGEEVAWNPAAAAVGAGDAQHAWDAGDAGEAQHAGDAGDAGDAQDAGDGNRVQAVATEIPLELEIVGFHDPLGPVEVFAALARDQAVVHNILRTDAGSSDHDEVMSWLGSEGQASWILRCELDELAKSLESSDVANR